jgi:hypothetical protein
MKCNHCLTDYHASEEVFDLGQDKDSWWVIVKLVCPACSRMNLYLGSCLKNIQGEIASFLKSTPIRPKSALRPPPPVEVPKHFSDDYIEACLVISDSPKASAALSRRCLQHILRDKAGVKHSDLASEIQQVLDSHTLPTHLAESLDAIRHTGNFAAHPIKSKSTGEILPVEPGEAEWNLDVLEELYDFYFVKPEVIKRKRAALDKKLADAGKPKMK